MMNATDFKAWLVDVDHQTEKTSASRTSRCKRIDEEYDLDAQYDFDKCNYLLGLFEFSKSDFLAGKSPLHGIFIDGNTYNGTASFRQAIKNYVRFKDAITKKLAKKKSNRAPFVSKYTGNYEGFIHFVNGYCRNLVNIKTKSLRYEHRGICEYCKKSATLESAHLYGLERPVIIRNILEKYYKVSANNYDVDLNDFEEKFIKVQQPYEKHFYFLCRKCHKAYDDGKIKPAQMKAKAGR